jgi:hypothetical protein
MERWLSNLFLSFRIFISVHTLCVSDFQHLFSVILWLSATFLCHSLFFRTFSLSFSGFPHFFSVILWVSHLFSVILWLSAIFSVILWLSALSCSDFLSYYLCPFKPCLCPSVSLSHDIPPSLCLYPSTLKISQLCLCPTAHLSLPFLTPFGLCPSVSLSQYLPALSL